MPEDDVLEAVGVDEAGGEEGLGVGAADFAGFAELDLEEELEVGGDAGWGELGFGLLPAVLAGIAACDGPVAFGWLLGEEGGGAEGRSGEVDCDGSSDGLLSSWCLP